MTAVLIALFAFIVAGFVYSLKRNGRQMMADLDRLDERTCPPVDDRTRFLKMMDEEFRK